MSAPLLYGAFLEESEKLHKTQGSRGRVGPATAQALADATFAWRHGAHLTPPRAIRRGWGKRTRRRRALPDFGDCMAAMDIMNGYCVLRGLDEAQTRTYILKRILDP